MKLSDTGANRSPSLESKMGQILKIWYIIEVVLILIVAVIACFVAYDVLKETSHVVIVVIGIAYVVWLFIRTAQYRHDRMFAEIAEDIRAIRFTEESKFGSEIEAQKIEERLKRLIENNEDNDTGSEEQYNQDKDAENETERLQHISDLEVSEKWKGFQQSSANMVSNSQNAVDEDKTYNERHTDGEPENYPNAELYIYSNALGRYTDDESTAKTERRYRRLKNQSNESGGNDDLREIDCKCILDVPQNANDKDRNTEHHRRRREEDNNIKKKTTYELDDTEKSIITRRMRRNRPS